MPGQVHSLVSVNCQWPGFSKSPPWGTRGARFATAIKSTRASLVLAQEIGWDRAHTFSFAMDLAERLGKTWFFARAQGGGLGLNCVFWDTDEWQQDGDLFDIDLPSFGQQARTLIAAPLEHVRTGERITAGSSHLANNSAPEIRRYGSTPAIAQARQADRISGAMKNLRRVVIGMDSNNKTNLGPGRRSLVKSGWKITSNGIDIVAAKPGVVIGKKRLIAVPSDHSRAIVAEFTTNTGASPL